MTHAEHEAAHKAAEAKLGKTYEAHDYPLPCRFFKHKEHGEARAFMWALAAIVAPRYRVYLMPHDFGFYTEIVKINEQPTPAQA
jgi:hypothetical protein